MICAVLSLRRLDARGNLRALVDVALTFGSGDSITLHGCRVIRQEGQKPYLALPQVETPGGKFFAAISAPGLREAVQTAVLAAWGSAPTAEAGAKGQL